MLVLPWKFQLILLFFNKRSIHEPFIWDAEGCRLKRTKGCCSCLKEIRGSHKSQRAFPHGLQGTLHLPLPSVLVFRLSVRSWTQALWPVGAWVLTCSITVDSPAVLPLSLFGCCPSSICHLSSSFFPAPVLSVFSHIFQQDEDYWVRKFFFKWFNKTLCIILKVNPEFS